ncbi:MAG TPA: hypothetical protein VFV99_14005 [Kofleriaceae bacterium]|nr:hypothetical protein [Kofleriaceae bacterium]
MRLWLVVAVVLAACGGEGEFHDAASPPLCALCTSDTDCETGICWTYGNGQSKCTHTCTAGEEAADCPTGRCNGMGYCMCPGYEPPTDAGIDDAQKDAPEVPPADAPTDGA